MRRTVSATADCLPRPRYASQVNTIAWRFRRAARKNVRTAQQTIGVHGAAASEKTYVFLNFANCLTACALQQPATSAAVG